MTQRETVETAMAPRNTGPYRSGRRRAHRPISLAGLPTPEELDAAAEFHQDDAADRFSLYTPEQIVALTKTSKIAMTFDEPIKIRDQAEMILACMRVVIELTRRHKIGAVRQRIETRREVASLVERLTILNGRTPYGYRRKPR